MSPAAGLPRLNQQLQLRCKPAKSSNSLLTSFGSLSSELSDMSEAGRLLCVLQSESRTARAIYGLIQVTMHGLLRDINPSLFAVVLAVTIVISESQPSEVSLLNVAAYCLLLTCSPHHGNTQNICPCSWMFRIVDPVSVSFIRYYDGLTS
ncbi:uncharacterized protein B0H18DRAFT_1055048 [Fomitopsis serialis]|uniref:uncharacterized protein n=1 Tax=Fomitopsis serialis TaxID=139415 RepID=UPI002008C030|nr:uncharacterized protein B0H18DRAFT_1055048 [Neoantrodia serialis]KAH9912272.1 hypothetical protein B0H18DRAFT_1055048 [Neoantrodia serialis]